MIVSCDLGIKGARISMRKRLRGIPARKLPWDILDSNHHWSPRRDDWCNLQTHLCTTTGARLPHLLPYCWQESASWHGVGVARAASSTGIPRLFTPSEWNTSPWPLSGVAMCWPIWHGCLTSSLWIDAGVLLVASIRPWMRTSGSTLYGNMDGLRSGAKRSAVWRSG